MKEFVIDEDFSKSEIEFDHRFSNVDECYAYLSSSKWTDGFSCEKCGNN